MAEPRQNEDLQRGMRDAMPTPRAVWQVLRAEFSASVVALVDQVDELGGLEFRDLILLELAELMTINERLKATKLAKKDAAQARADARQIRKNLRALLVLQGPKGGANNEHVPLPPGLGWEALARFLGDKGDKLLRAGISP